MTIQPLLFASWNRGEPNYQFVARNRPNLIRLDRSQEPILLSKFKIRQSDQQNLYYDLSDISCLFGAATLTMTAFSILTINISMLRIKKHSE